MLGGGSVLMWGGMMGMVGTRAAAALPPVDTTFADTTFEATAFNPTTLRIAALDGGRSEAATGQQAQVDEGLIDRGQSLYEAGRYQEALRVLKQQLAEAQQAGQATTQAATLGNMALVYQALGEPDRAQATIAQAQAILNTDATASSSPSQLSTALLSIQAQIHLNRGEAKAALEVWQRVEQQYRRMADMQPSSVTSTQMEQGQIQRVQIHQAQALQQLGFYGRALKQLVALKTEIQAQPDNAAKLAQLRVLGDAFQLTGDATQARESLDEALELSQTLADSEDVRTRVQLAQETAALRLSLGNVDQAEQKWDAAIAQYQQAAEMAPTTVLRLQAQVNQLTVRLAQKDWTAAEALIRPIQRELADVPPSLDAVYAQLQFAQGLMQLPQRFQSQRLTAQMTAQTLAQALEQAKRLGDGRSQSYALGYLGQLYQQSEQTDDALALTRRALRLAEQMEAPEIRYRWYWQLGQLLKQEGDRDGAIGAYDAAIADLKILRGDLAAVNRDVQFSFRESVEPVYRESVALLLEGDGSRAKTKASIKASTKASAKASSPNVVLNNADPKILDKARRRIEDLQLAELDNFFREACLDSQTVLLDKVVDQDNPTAAVIYPIILENKLEVIVKVPQQPLRQYTIDQSQEEVETVAKQLQESLLEPDETFEVKQLSKQLYDWLIQPIEQELDAVDTLVFVLDGPLRSVPMAVLYDGDQYLVENYAVALSLGLQLIDPKPLTQTRLEVLAAGLAEPPEDFQQFSPLPQVSEEIAGISKTVSQSKQLLDQDFTREQFETSMNEVPFNVVHLATHGQFSSDADKTFVLAADGPIKVNDFDTLLRNRATRQQEPIELLVLSACQTATGDDRAALGLAGVAVRAGARSTLASLWNIGDSSTSLLVSEFYRELANEKISKAEALRRAQLKLLNDDSGFSRPSAWAPYVLVGNWL